MQLLWMLHTSLSHDTVANMIISFKQDTLFLLCHHHNWNSLYFLVSMSQFDPVQHLHFEGHAEF